MKNTTASASGKKDGQDNIGYENTEVRNDQDDKENGRVQTTDTGNREGARENEDDTEGLRSESGKKSLGSVEGNKEDGENTDKPGK